MGYLLGGLPLAIVAFVIAVAGFSAGVGTLVVWVGLPVLVLTLRAARGFAVVERRSTEWATGRPLPPHHYRGAGGRGVGRWFNALAEPQSWRDLVHAVVGFPVRLVTFVLAVAWTVGGVGGLLYVAWQWALPENDEKAVVRRPEPTVSMTVRREPGSRTASPTHSRSDSAGRIRPSASSTRRGLGVGLVVPPSISRCRGTGG
jgi:hypothetical protein